MGCKASQVKGDGSPVLESEGADGVKLPDVPPGSWYAKPFEEPSRMEMSEFHSRNKGRSLFSTRLLPASRQQFDMNPSVVELCDQFVLGVDTIYGMGYFHNTALLIEHRWRTRVSFEPKFPTRFDRPFYNMFLGLKIIVNGQLVPDLCAFEGSLPGCTATIRAAEATTTWLCVPIILCGDLNNRVLTKHHTYKSTMFNFLSYMSQQPPGSYKVRVDAVYGCHQENNFQTDFIATGSTNVVVMEDSKTLITPMIEKLSAMMKEDGPNPASHIDNAGGTGSETRCPQCQMPKDLCCTVCGASVCGSPSCIRMPVNGYPFGCRSHKAVV